MSEDIKNNNSNSKVKLLDPKLDAIFQILFSKANPEIVKSFLSTILDVPITNLENNTVDLDLNKIFEITYPEDKIGVLDVRISINDEIEIDLEMQMAHKDMLIERILWYWAKLYSEQLKVSDKYKKLKKTLEILIINDKIPELKNIPKPCTRWQIREHEIFSEILTDKLEIIIIELPKVEQAYLKDKHNKLLQWMMFLLNPESLEVSNIMEKNEDIKVATQGLQKISKDKVARRIAELRFKARMDEIDNRLTGERIGREQGERIGREKAEKEFEEKTAQNLKNIINKMFNLGLPINQISEITGLSIEEIEKNV